MYDGIAGIVKEPYRGARDGGVVGAMLGVGKGLMSCPFKMAEGKRVLARRRLTTRLTVIHSILRTSRLSTKGLGCCDDQSHTVASS